MTGGVISQIRPGVWPRLQQLKMSDNNLGDDLMGGTKELLCLRTLSGLSLGERGLSAEAIGQIKPGDWPHLQILMIGYNHVNDAPVGAMRGLLYLNILIIFTLRIVGGVRRKTVKYMQLLESNLYIT